MRYIGLTAQSPKDIDGKAIRRLQRQVADLAARNAALSHQKAAANVMAYDERCPYHHPVDNGEQFISCAAYQKYVERHSWMERYKALLPIVEAAKGIDSGYFLDGEVKIDRVLVLRAALAALEGEA